MAVSNGIGVKVSCSTIPTPTPARLGGDEAVLAAERPSEAVAQRHHVVAQDLAAGHAHIDAAGALGISPRRRHSAPRRRIDRDAGAGGNWQVGVEVTLMFIARALNALTGLVSGALARRTKRWATVPAEGLGARDPLRQLQGDAPAVHVDPPAGETFSKPPTQALEQTHWSWH